MHQFFNFYLLNTALLPLMYLADAAWTPSFISTHHHTTAILFAVFSVCVIFVFFLFCFLLLMVLFACPPPCHLNVHLPVDVWSVGCIVAEMIRGSVLFPGTDRILHCVITSFCVKRSNTILGVSLLSLCCPLPSFPPHKCHLHHCPSAPAYCKEKSDSRGQWLWERMRAMNVWAACEQNVLLFISGARATQAHLLQKYQW